MLQRLLSLAAGVLGLALLIVLAPMLDRFNFKSERPVLNPPETGAPTTRVPASVMPPEGLAIERDPNGQFRADVLINDQPFRLLVDTGADGLVLTEADAQTLNIAPDPSTYRAVARTASGVGYGARVRIDRLEISGRDLGPTDALVVQGLGTSLLGRSVLDRIGPVTMAGDHMTVGN